MKNLIRLKFVIMGASLLFTTIGFAQKNKTIDGKKYNVDFYEMKAATGRGKALPSTVNFKSGKIGSDLMEEKIQLSSTPYKMINDSTYTEDESEMHVYMIEAEYSDDKNDYKWTATINNSDIDGTVILSRNGVEKRKFEFSGSEKAKK